MKRKINKIRLISSSGYFSLTCIKQIVILLYASKETGDMYYMIKFSFNKLIVFLSLLLFISCAKTPDAPVHPSVAIAIEKNIFLVNFTCGITNENDSAAFTDVEGVINIHDNGGLTLLDIHFDIPVILPFATIGINEMFELSEDAVTPLLALLKIDKDKLKSGEDAGRRYIDEKNIKFKELNLKKNDITELLRGKI